MFLILRLIPTMWSELPGGYIGTCIVYVCMYMYVCICMYTCSNPPFIDHRHSHVIGMALAILQHLDRESLSGVLINIQLCMVKYHHKPKIQCNFQYSSQC